MLLVPAIAYYETLRELKRRSARTQIARLKRFSLPTDRLIPLTTPQLELAARLWAEARRAGTPTAREEALDVDAIVAAQALSLGLHESEYVVATTNPAHLSRYVPAQLWTDLAP